MSQTLNALLISNSSQVGGGNRSLLLLANSLKRKDCEVTIAVPSEGPMADACRAEGVEFYIIDNHELSWKKPVSLLKLILEWKSVIKKTGCNIIHANDVMTARSVSIASKICRVPLVCHVRFPLSSEVSEWVFRKLPKPSAFIFNSHALRKECGPHIEKACPRTDQYVVHNAVNLEQFQPEPKRSKPYRVGILANLIPIKGHSDFLEMANLIRKQGYDFEYSIIGEDIHDTGYKSELQQQSNELGLTDCVQFLGHRNDIPDQLNELNVLVCASHVEPFGRCLIEAMACEKPVVASRVGGIPEVVDDGVTGFLVPAHSPRDLAKAVMQLHDDPSLAEMMGKAGRVRAEKLFAPDAHAQSIIDIYKSIL